MEEASGGNLLGIVQKQKRIAEKQAVVWFRQIIDAIDYCHQRGIVHRDLKCENLLIDLKVLSLFTCRLNLPRNGVGAVLLHFL